MNKNTKAFTFVEIIIVLGIIGFILMIVMPNYLDARGRATVNNCVSNQRVIHTAASLYTISESTSLEAMSNGERLAALVEREYLRGMEWRECPLSGDGDLNDYEIIFEEGVVSDVECSEKPTLHVWP